MTIDQFQNVRRYDLDKGECIEHPDGEYVIHETFAELLAQYKQLVGSIADIKDKHQ